MKISNLSAIIALCVMLVAAPGAIQAQNVDKSKTAATKFSERLSLDVYGGYLQGESRETVYNASTGYKVSELFWNIQSAFVVGGTLSVRPLDWLSLKVGGWTPVSSRNKMDDYDWLKDGQADWSDWSNHPDTKLIKAHMIDAGVGIRVAKFDKNSLFDRAQLELLGGYRWLYLNWTSYGGSYISTTAADGFRGDSGTFTDGQPVIGYEQWIETPYIGVGGSMNMSRWTFAGQVTGSLWGRMRDRDNHYLRTKLFEESFTGVTMLATELSASYAVMKNLSLFGSFSYQKYFEAQGASTMSDYTTGEVSHFGGNAAGMDHQSMLLTLGLKF
jgi:plasminogen activator